MVGTQSSWSCQIDNHYVYKEILIVDYGLKHVWLILLGAVTNYRISTIGLRMMFIDLCQTFWTEITQCIKWVCFCIAWPFSTVRKKDKPLSSSSAQFQWNAAKIDYWSQIVWKFCTLVECTLGQLCPWWISYEIQQGS